MDQFALTPRQTEALENVLAAARSQKLIALECASGMGRTTLLRRACARLGAHYASLETFLADLTQRHPAAIEETFYAWAMALLAAHDRVAIDDLHLIQNVAEGCDYPRGGVLDLALTSLLDTLAASGKQLIVGVTSHKPTALAMRAHSCELGDFKAEDYACLGGAVIGAERCTKIDFGRVHHFAPAMTVWQLKNAFAGVAADADTDTFIAYLNEHNLASNVDIEEVRPVTWADLKGMDDVVAALEAKIALPFDRHDLAEAYALKPRRGVVLAGPPGTGKTTIGRALAHRLKGKFFLIDGTDVAGSRYFYSKLDEVFEAAAHNAPSVVFIDDGDLIFEADGGKDFYRYLLTKLDGLESVSADRVCVMITAMDVASLPPALVRSGRIELWLETRLPDEAARREILQAALEPVAALMGNADLVSLATASRNFTAADLKSIVEDAKLLAAHDRSRELEARSADDYLWTALASQRAKRRVYSKRRASPEKERIGFSSELLEMATDW